MQVSGQIIFLYKWNRVIDFWIQKRKSFPDVTNVRFMNNADGVMEK